MAPSPVRSSCREIRFSPAGQDIQLRRAPSVSLLRNSQDGHKSEMRLHLRLFIPFGRPLFFFLMTGQSFFVFTAEALAISQLAAAAAAPLVTWNQKDPHNDGGGGPYPSCVVVAAGRVGAGRTAGHLEHNICHRVFVETGQRLDPAKT